ncbi:neprosin family prolyl endopeptidase [Actinoplanes regularis]|uniref:neprosin family prolyl endopeptidase n=1 Tax=Actinoplanes regularis TaxID=52697 RepID=UPI0024A5574A|nr:neprosin family prolyl endopeptidase [Actinoplanes regularis]GLW32007.1 hypothetical protein Areg01_49460 [Actinoplanes regularis]
MLKSRRGLLAAGLTVAVIGAIGVASTLEAGAEQIPDAPVPATAATAPLLKPPATLPWGDRPQRVKRGRDGADSKSLKAAGLSVAGPAEGDDGTPEEEYAPKGDSSKSGHRRPTSANAVPPDPSAEPSASASSGPKANFFYNTARQYAVSDGAYVNLTIHKPTLDKSEFHTLAELAVRSEDGDQTVEVGWNVDRLVNGDDDPHLFVYHWVNDQPTCYNGCGFVQYSKTVIPGFTLAVDQQKRFGIQFTNNAWWIAYDTEWVGYYPAGLWTKPTFTKSGLVQVFGEVATPPSTVLPLSQMGSGKCGRLENTAAARLGSVAYLNGPTPEFSLEGDSAAYGIYGMSSRTFRYGGPGSNGPEKCKEQPDA